MGSNPTLSAMLNRRKEAKHSLHSSQNEGRAAAKWWSDWTAGPCRKVQTIVVCWLVEEVDERMSHLWRGVRRTRQRGARRWRGGCRLGSTQEASVDCGLSEIDGQGLQSSLRRGWYYGPERFPDELLTRAATLLQQHTQVRRNYHGPELREHGQQAA